MVMEGTVSSALSNRLSQVHRQRELNQTEVGIIPSDWFTPQLQDLTEPSHPICYGIVQVGRFTPNGVPVLAIKNLGEDYRNGIHRCAPDIERPYQRSRVRSSDILVSIKGTAGRIGIVPSYFQGNISRDLARIRLRNEFVPEFVFQMLQADATQTRLSSATVGTTRLEISIGVLKNFRIPLPPTKREQYAIATILEDTDTQIRSIEFLIEKKRTIKHGIMHDLLSGRRRLPGFTSDWMTRSLGDIARIKTGMRNNQDKIPDGDYPFFVRSERIERINSFSHDCEAILVPGEGGIGSIFHYIIGRFDAHQRVYVINDFATDVSGRFIFYYMTQYFGAHAMENTVKATVDSLRLPTFQGFSLKIPSMIAEQHAIASILTEVDDEIVALEKKLTKSRLVKRGIMRELLTGKVRLV